ncbi:MAG TPA: glycosyltransferase [Bacteroidales bacterium]|nr:glycosyltransferase [Bacteroidales bacterium]
MLRIAFFTPGLKIGGIERVFITYAEAFIQQGYEVSYVICKDDGTFNSALPPELKVVSLGNRKLRHSIIPLYRYFKKSSIDYFITGSDIPNALSIILCKLSRSKTKVIISHHNYFNIEQHHLLSSLIIRLFYNKAHSIISVSKGITEMLLTRHVNRSKLKTIYNPINIDQLKKAAGENLDFQLPEKFLLFLGRLGEVKNLPFLIDSFHLAHLKDTDLHLVILGEGPMISLLKQKTENLSLNSRIHFLESMSNPFPVLKMASAVILPSFSEALPTVILESLAMGKTIVATPTQGALDLLEYGKFGYLSKSFVDIVEFATLIEKGVKEPFSMSMLELKAEQYDIARKTRELEALFT